MAAYAPPLRRPPSRAPRIILAVTIVALAVFAGVAVHVRRDVVPPDCRDPRTLALVRQSLENRFHLPPSTRIDGITVQAGGWLAFRFVCVADVHVPEDQLPPGPRPGEVHYTSTLTDNGTRHLVTVTLSPLLKWFRAE